MAVSFSTPSTGAIAPSTSCTVSHTVSAGSNLALWVFAICWNSTDYLSSGTCTYGGTSLGSSIYNVSSLSGTYLRVWQMAAPPAGTANVVVTPSASAYLDVWVISASGVDQALLAQVSSAVNYASQFSTSPQSQSVTVPASGACLSFGAYRNTGASTVSAVGGNGVTSVGTPPTGYAHTVLGTGAVITSHGWSWTNGSPGSDTFAMLALPINAAAASSSSIVNNEHSRRGINRGLLRGMN